MTNPLVAAPSSAGPGPIAGLAPAEDIQQIYQAIQSGSWVDGALGLAGGALDALAFVSDPIGSLLQYGVAWIIEHVKPLSEALDWLAGDPSQVTAQARTWTNIAGRLAGEADALAQSVRWDTADWHGGAAEAYRSHAARRMSDLRALSRASDTMALITEGAGMLVGTVRIMVRDAIATVVSRLISYAVEVLASLGTATPLVVEQVATLCASWAAKIGRWLKQLVASMQKLAKAMKELGEAILALRKGGKGADDLVDMGKRSNWKNPGDRPQAPSRPPDGYLPTGDPVYHGPNSTAVGYDSSTMRNFDHVEPKPGVHDVVVHGEPNGTFRPGVVGEDGGKYPHNYTSPEQIAQAVRDNPNYVPGQPVRLVSCHTGRVDADPDLPGLVPAGQQVADSLGVPVEAPTQAVGVPIYGSGKYVPRIANKPELPEGKWVTFWPRD
ncbi:WXG100 family type VII secretion target [Paractinoplanes atraurantiacus]|uniref:WXG100 family type VII secretion target n=1 Tax=Paractinoplanes atraurantiacus TaxID=1036182 RepID=A0A285KS24_9ACTN|nr:hypothetical protein [Actinoplanes atraurantiacus]SNY74061.1 hypothetical protein SAMN05421748_15011 [Actinoplanes atraurantiacus]